ncbi:hypothetical protein C1701_22735 [Actinoalloteichus sp. AHMU CJ021]|uniref:Uncharacterized protein n=1 Tax=Actinoalloteichus caeruleus DSM 43889 TaxID=1120930 RepID=A0ABT1JC56_ACTCY|nr:hypothetical protein [Actinoalloteichus caeruleus]AUS80692.1 hypothetical protein C1701_22735 [Actinoalloteichus sp. AHMU CJ021]MCP2330081.1 hypothetical protein [Actinoalloteichus caeruleus DSM 43889]
MAKLMGAAGFLLTLMGISGTIDHLAAQPILGFLLNGLNREVFERFEAFSGVEVYANLTVSVLGVVLMVLSDRLGRG